MDLLRAVGRRPIVAAAVVIFIARLAAGAMFADRGLGCEHRAAGCDRAAAQRGPDAQYLAGFQDR